MAMFTSCAGTYSNACNLMEALKTQGVRSNIGAGGIDIHCTPDQINTAKSICNAYSASFDAGYTSHEQNLLLKSEDGLKQLNQSTGDALSLIKEWK